MTDDRLDAKLPVGNIADRFTFPYLKAGTMQLIKTMAKSWVKCACCGEQVRTCEDYFQVVRVNGKNVKGERYCVDCEDVAYENNPELNESTDVDVERNSEAEREEFAAYLVNGCAGMWHEDQDNKRSRHTYHH